MDRFAEQHREIDRLNARSMPRFRLLKGIEANIRADGDGRHGPPERTAASISSSPRRTPACDRRRTRPDGCWRRCRAAAVHILGHPRGRMFGSRPGVTADWDRVFAAAAPPAWRSRSTAILAAGRRLLRWRAGAGRRLPVRARQRRARRSASGPMPKPRSRTRASRASLADRIINCWPLERLREWAAARSA